MLGGGGGPGRWDWTRNKQAAETMLKEKKQPSKGSGGTFEKFVDILLTVLLIGGIAYFIITSLF